MLSINLIQGTLLYFLSNCKIYGYILNINFIELIIDTLAISSVNDISP